MTTAAVEPSRSAGAPICVPDPSTKDTPGYPSTVHSWSEALVRTSVRYTLPAPAPPSWSWIVPVSCAAEQKPPPAGGDTLGDGAGLADGEGEVEGDGAALADGEADALGSAGGAALADGESDALGSAGGAALADGESDALGSADGVGTSLVASADGDASDEADGAADPPSSGPEAVQPLTATSAPAAAMAVIQRLLPSKVVIPSPYVRCTRRPVGRTGFRWSVP